MTNDQRLKMIYELQVETADKVGTMHGRLHSIEADMSAVREGFVQQGLALAVLKTTCAERGKHCGARFKRISSEVGAVQEDTGVFALETVKRKTTLRTLAKISAAVLAIATVVAAFWGALTSCQPAQARPVAVPMMVPVEQPTEQLERLTEGQAEVLRRLPDMAWFNIGVKPIGRKRR